jgi:hypothetical protein
MEKTTVEMVLTNPTTVRTECVKIITSSANRVDAFLWPGSVMETSIVLVEKMNLKLVTGLIPTNQRRTDHRIGHYVMTTASMEELVTFLPR